jgi:HEAT repeat protein
MTTRTWFVLLCALGIGSSALAVPGGKGGKKGKASDLSPMIAALGGTEDEAAAKAADDLGDLADPAAHDALLDALAFGLRPPVAVPALAALAKHPAPPDVASLKRYAGHHNPSVRGSAFAVLALYPDPAAHAIVVLGLHDPVTAVRNAAAQAAAKGHVREATDSLFELLVRGEDSASRALAAMADAELVRRIGDQLGKVPDATLAQCLGLVLKRPDYGPDTARVDVVRAIAKIQDVAAVNALRDYIDATPKNPPRPSRAEAEKIVDARGGK